MSAKKRGGNLNTNDEADVKSGIILNTTTSIKIADANPERIHFEVSIIPDPSGAKSLVIKNQPASKDNDIKGNWLGVIIMGNNTGFRTFYELPTSNPYTGEVSAQAIEGEPTVFVTEW